MDVEQRLADIRVKLDRLAASDRQCSVFGAGGRDGHGYRERPRLDAAHLEHLEKRHGIALPEELRAFLRSVHGGGPGPGYGLFIGEPAPGTSRAAAPFPYDDRDAAELMVRRQTDRYAGLPLVDDPSGSDDELWPPGPGFVSLSHHGCGSFDVIVVTGAERGRIWFCDMKWFPRRCAHGTKGFLDWYEDWLDESLVKSTAI